MVLRFFLFSVVFLFVSCADTEFNNPYDPDSPNYIGKSSSSSDKVTLSSEKQSSSSDTSPSSSSSSFVSSSSTSVQSSSSSVVATLSSSSARQSSSSFVAVTSSSSTIVVTLSSSSVTVSSSSSLVPSSSSAQSSSSVAISSSSLTPSSSSVVPSSSSVQIQTGIIKSTPVDYQGETYETVVIGTQTWMARNLNYNAIGSKCYDNNEANCAIYGRLYDWATAMALPATCKTSSCSGQIKANHQGICPTSWHIPSHADWNVLMKFVNPNCSDNSSCNETKLKATSGWSEPGNGEDTYGFSALPGGLSYFATTFNFVGKYGWWWSASEDSSISAYSRYMSYADYVVYDINAKNILYSVRCLKD